jgi:hypothetical protein
MKQKHCYLFALEVAPLHVGDVFDELGYFCLKDREDLVYKVKPIL